MPINGTAPNAWSGSLWKQGENLGDKLKLIPAATWRRLLIAALAVWLVYSLSKLFWLVIPNPDIPEPSLAPPSNLTFTQNTDNTGPAVDIAQIKNLKVFGDASAVPVEPVVQVAPGIEDLAKETNLNLVLVGVTQSDRENLVSAIIANGAKQKTYRIGDELEMNPKGVKLVKVLPNRVILDNRGNPESLSLFEDSGVANASRRTTSRAPAPPNQFLTSRREQERLEDLRDAMGLEADVAMAGPTTEQVKAVTDVIKVQMHRENGQFQGFKIRPGRNRQIFDSLGLQANDIVVAVNNIRLDDTQKAMEVYRSLGQEKAATLEVLRDGFSQTVTVNLDQMP